MSSKKQVVERKKVSEQWSSITIGQIEEEEEEKISFKYKSLNVAIFNS